MDKHSTLPPVKKQSAPCEDTAGCVGAVISRATATSDQRRALDDDGFWFKSHPDRWYRARRVLTGDLPNGVELSGPGYVIARLAFPLGTPCVICVYVPIAAVAGADLDSDADLAAVWKRAAAEGGAQP